MERLEPVLKQKFWILLGVAVIMTFVGWWMATGKMAQAIEERQKKIEAAFSSVPGGEIPNESWATRLGAVNTSQDDSIKTTKLELWNRQVAKMTWPDGVVPQNGYWGKFSNEGREQFRETWRQEVRRVWLLLNPLDEDGKGVIDYPLTNMGKVLKKGNWKAAPPDSDVMWEGREDLWLLESLFHSLTAINGGPNATRADASIHQIDKLELRGGGEKKSAGGAAAADAGGMGGMAAMMGGAGYASSGSSLPNAGGAGPGGVLSQGLTTVSAEFDPTDEFGDDGGGGSGPMGGGSSSPMSSMGSMGAMGGMGGDMAAAAPEKKVARYLILDEKLPYKQRGFYLSVKMDHRKIPQLIAELTSNEKSAWPVEITRVQMSRLNEDDSPGSIPGGSSGASSTSMTSMSMMPRLPSNYPTGGVTGSSSGLGGLGEDEFSAQFASTAFGNPEQVAMAKSVLDIALRDPVMAQVTISGTFTIYKKVDPPETKPVMATPAAGSTDESANSDGKTDSVGDKTEGSDQAAVEGAKTSGAPATSDDAPPAAAATDDSPPTATAASQEEKADSDKPPVDKPEPDKPEADSSATDKKPD